MSQNILQLDQDKTEVLIIRSKARMENLASKHEAQGLNPSQETRNLGVIFDSDLEHMYTVSPKQFFHHLKNLTKVRPFLSLSNKDTIESFYHSQTKLL